jgi:3-keto-L-gulonate-6-phosphate decarboxylase
MLNRKKHYLQIACNSTLDDARRIITKLPVSDRIIIEAGTPLIKRYGTEAITSLRQWSQRGYAPMQIAGDIEQQITALKQMPFFGKFAAQAMEQQRITALNQRATRLPEQSTLSYVVADLKCIDRGEAEAALAARAGASAAVVMGSAPIETINRFIAACHDLGIDSMIDMMAVDQPIKIMRRLKRQPTVVILHRGVDETSDNKTRSLPIHQIAKIKGSWCGKIFTNQPTIFKN